MEVSSIGADRFRGRSSSIHHQQNRFINCCLFAKTTSSKNLQCCRAFL